MIIEFLKERWVWLVTRLLAPFVFLMTLWERFYTGFVNGINAVTAQVETIASTTSLDASAFSAYLAYANAFAPLTEVLVMAGLWLGLKLLIVLVRLIKGALPTYG